jgi:hypothetical protein
MKCSQCQHENPPQAKFCLECGARVALTCTKCRNELPAGAKFCLECGEPVASQATAGPRFTSPEAHTPKHLAEKILTSKAALEGERKQVTVLFADLKGSMELLANRDPEEARKILDPVLELMLPAGHRLLKAYFKVHDRETHRKIREKVMGKLLTLDRTLEPILPALRSIPAALPYIPGRSVRPRRPARGRSRSRRASPDPCPRARSTRLRGVGPPPSRRDCFAT